MYVIDTKMDYPKTRSNINKSLRFMDIDNPSSCPIVKTNGKRWKQVETG